MPFTTYPLNRINYNAEDAELYNCTRNSGVYANNHFQCSVTGTNNDVTLGKGIAWVHNSEFSGKVVANKSTEVIQCGLPDSSLPRVDVIAIRFSKDTNLTEYVVKKGTPASTPTMPAISQTETIYELYLYKIHRPVGATVITHSQITDLRLDPALCGVMGDSVTRVDTSAINSQFTELLNSLKDEIDAINKGTDVMLKPVYDPRGKATDIFAAIPGRDLLDNSLFTAERINQREVSGTISTAGYCIDRWKLISGSITLAADGITLNGSMAQILEYAAGTDVTASVGMVSGTATAAYNNATKTLTITSTGGKIKWVKLETGGVATPYLPKGYAAEWCECARYYARAFFALLGAGQPVCSITWPVQMRVVPSTTLHLIAADNTPKMQYSYSYGGTVQSTSGSYATGVVKASADL